MSLLLLFGGVAAPAESGDRRRRLIATSAGFIGILPLPNTIAAEDRAILHWQFRYGAPAPAVPGTPFRPDTTDTILNLPARIPGFGWSVRFDVLDQTLTKRFELNPIMSGATINANTNATIKRTLNGLQLTPGDEARLKILSHRVRPMFVLKDTGDEYPLGVFIWSSADRRRTSEGLYLTGSLEDQTRILEQGRPAAYSLPSGSSVRTAILDVAAEYGFSDTRVNVDTTDKVTSGPTAWPAGTTGRTIINALCAMVGFYSAYFDNAGVLRCREVPTPLSAVDADHTYLEGADCRMVRNSLLESDDLIDAPSRYLVINTTSTDVEIAGFYDVPDDAPQSAVNRGFVFTKVIEMQGAQDSVAAQSAAQAAAAQDMSAYLWVEFVAPIDPRHGLHEVVNYLGTNMREQSWQLNLTSGEHLHKLRLISS